MGRRPRQDSSRIAALARKSSNGIGRFLVHSPPGERKSGIPHSVEMPAPVKGRIRSASLIRLRKLEIAVVRSGGGIAILSFRLSPLVVRNSHAISAHHAARA